MWPVKNQRCFVFEAGRLKLVRHLAEGVLDESPLQRRLLALSPGPQDELNDGHCVALTVGSLLVRDCLCQSPELIKAFRSAAPVDPRIAGNERSQVGMAVSLFFHCFATVCCGR